MALFADRVEAGRRLAARLGAFAQEDPLVLGIPRGGVPVAAEVARALGAPLDVAVVRKLGVPSQPELAMGAVGEGDVRVLEDRVLHGARVTAGQLADVERRERAVVAERAASLRRGRAAHPVAGRTVVLVDDGIATGSTMRAACLVVRHAGARRVVVAVPVSSVEGVQCLRGAADEVVALATPDPFWSVGEWYDAFGQVSDAEVGRILGEAAPAPPPD